MQFQFSFFLWMKCIHAYKISLRPNSPQTTFLLLYIFNSHDIRRKHGSSRVRKKSLNITITNWVWIGFVFSLNLTIHILRSYTQVPFLKKYICEKLGYLFYFIFIITVYFQFCNYTRTTRITRNLQLNLLKLNNWQYKGTGLKM